MQFVLSSLESNIVFNNILKIKANLRSGVAEVYQNHQELLGKVTNNLIQVETNFENQLKKYYYVIQEGVLSVAKENTTKETVVNVFAKKIYLVNPDLLNSNTSLDFLTKACENIKMELETEIKLLANIPSYSADEIFSPKRLALEEEKAFLESCLLITKKLRGSYG